MKTEALSSWQLSKSLTRLMLPSVCAVLGGSCQFVLCWLSLFIKTLTNARYRRWCLYF